MMEKHFKSLSFVFLAASLAFAFKAKAQVGSVENLIYQGRIANNGIALNAGVTTFEISIFGGASNCLLYRETFSKDMTSASGHYSLAIGSGTRTDTLFGGGAPTHTLSNALRNIGTISGLDCNGSSGTFDTTLTPTIDRRFQLRFNPGGGWVSLPSQAIKSTPYAMQAMQVNGYGLSNLAKISGAGASTVMSPAGWAKVMDYSELGNIILGTAAAVTCDSTRAGGLRYNAGVIEFCNGTAWGALSAGGSGITALSGDVTASGTGSVAATISNDTVTYAKLQNISATQRLLGRFSAGAGDTEELTLGSGLNLSGTGVLSLPTGCSSTEILKWNGTAWACAADATGTSPGDASYTVKGIVQFDTNAATSGLTVATGVARLANSGVTAGTYGSATQVPAITVDAFGRVTSATAITIAVPASAIASGTLNISQGGTGVSSLTANRMVMVNGTGTALNNDACTVNQVLQFNGTTWACVAGSSLGSTSAVLNGGNSFAGTMTVGTNDNNELRFETNGTDKMTVLANGNVGIGTTTPISRMSVEDSDASTMLMVVNNSSTAARSPALQVVNYASTFATLGRPEIRLFQFRGNRTTTAPVQSGDTLGQITFLGGNNAPGIGSISTSIRSVATENFTVTSSGGRIDFDTTANGTVTAATRMSINQDGRVGIGTTSPGALLDVTSTTSGVLIPRMTTAQRDAIATPANGLQVYNTTTNQLNYYNGSSWQALGVAGAGISSLTAGSGLTGGTITTSGTIAVDTGTTANKIVQLNASAELPTVSGVNLTSLNASNIASGTLAAARLPSSGVTAGSYGSATQVPAITVDAYGRVTAATATTIALPASAINSGTLDLARGGTGVTSLTANRLVMVNGLGTTLTNDACTVNQVLQYNGTTWACVAGSSLGSTSAVLNGGNSFAGTMTVGTNDNNELRFETNGTDKMTVLANGNVGIGTAAPATKLEVRDSADLTLGVVRTASGAIQLTRTDTESQILSASGSGATKRHMLFGTSDGVTTVPRMYISGIDGNVGIGTTSPRSRLEVAGGIQIADDSATCDATKVGTIRYNSSTIQFCNGSAWAGMAGGSGDLLANGTVPMTGNLRLGTNWLSGDGGNEGIRVAADGKVAVNATPSIFNFLVSGSTGISGSLTVQAGGLIETLEADDTAYTSSGTGIVPNANTVALRTYNNGTADGITSWLQMTARNANMNYQTAYMGVASTSGAGSYTPALIFGRQTATNSYNESMRIDSSGNVGIGITTVPEKLVVNGSAHFLDSQQGYIGNFGGTGITNMYIGTNIKDVSGMPTLVDTSASAWLLGLLQFTGAGDAFQITRVAPNGTFGARTYPFQINNSSFVGIGGFTNPGHVTSTLGVRGLASEPLVNVLTSVGAEALRVTSTGNMGIGTASPRSRLEVAGGIQIADDAATCDATKVGTIRYNSSTIQFCNGSAWAGIGGGAATILNGGNSFAGTMTIGTNDNNPLRFETNGTDKMTVLAGGNVGIGTTSPGERLDVTGNMRASGRMVAGVTTDADALSAVTLDFSASNMIRATAASGACGTLNFTNVAAGGSYTVTIPNATASCTTIQMSGSTTNVKLPSGYGAGGVAAVGLVYTAIFDGTTLWVSYVPF